jgi:hypothetical protein
VDGAATDAANDGWVSIDGKHPLSGIVDPATGLPYAPPDPGHGNATWIKVFNGGNSNQWVFHGQWDYNPSRPLAWTRLTKGIHSLRIAGRSQGFRLDRLHVYKRGTTNALDKRRPESPKGATIDGETPPPPPPPPPPPSAAAAPAAAAPAAAAPAAAAPAAAASASASAHHQAHTSHDDACARHSGRAAGGRPERGAGAPAPPPPAPAAIGSCEDGIDGDGDGRVDGGDVDAPGGSDPARRCDQVKPAAPSRPAAPRPCASRV